MDINIYDSDGNLVSNFVSQTSQPATWVPRAVGTYYIVIPGKGVLPIAVASILVVPESVLGTLMATVVGFAAVGTVMVVKRSGKGAIARN